MTRRELPNLVMTALHETNPLPHHRCHMFYPRRVVDIPDGKPKWTGINNESDLIEDSPKQAKDDLKRKREEEKEEKDEKK